MKKISVVLFVFAMLSGCATFGQMEEGLNALLEKDARTAFAVLGYPSGKQQFGNDTVYVWSSNRSGTLLLPQTSTTYGTVGTTPVYGTTTYNQAIPVNYSCIIKLVADSNDRVIAWEYDGNIGGCEKYIMNLKKYANRPVPVLNNRILDDQSYVKDLEKKLNRNGYDDRPVSDSHKIEFSEFWQKIQ